MNPMLKIAAGAVFTVSSVFAGAGALNSSTAQAAADYDGNCYLSGGLFYCTYSSENGIKHVKKTGTLVDQQVTIWDETYDHCPKEVTIGGWGDHISALAPMTLHVETCDGSGGNMRFHGVGDGGDDRGGSLRVATPRDTGDRESPDDGRPDADRDRDKDQREEEPRETGRGREDEPHDTGSQHREPHRGDADNDDATNDEPRERNAPATPPPSQPQLRSSDSPSQGGQLKSLVFRHVDLDAAPGIRAGSVPTPHIDDLIASGLVGTAVAGCWEPECGGGEVPRKFVSPSCLYIPMASKLLPWCASAEVDEIDAFQANPESVSPWKGVKVSFMCGIDGESGSVSFCKRIVWSPDTKPEVPETPSTP